MKEELLKIIKCIKECPVLSENIKEVSQLETNIDALFRVISSCKYLNSFLSVKSVQQEVVKEVEETKETHKPRKTTSKVVKNVDEEEISEKVEDVW